MQPHLIPPEEITIDFVRSSGPGGQNVNKLSTKAQARWNVGASRVFTAEQKAKIRQKLKNRLNNHDEIVVASSNERSQEQNKNNVLALLQTLVVNALKVPKKRIGTKPTRSSKKKRVETKVLHARIKRLRKAKFED